MKYLVIYLILINVLSFALYGVDKKKAKRKKWRIPESTLIGVAVLGGAFGAFLGMKVFHHKTKHAKFKITVPLFLLLQIGLIGYYTYQYFFL